MSRTAGPTNALASLAGFGFVALLVVQATAASGTRQSTPQPFTHTRLDQQRSATAFEAIVPVLRHPRCMNCHSSGDYPRQGDDSHPHSMNVKRGPDGHGVNAVVCSTCHQEHNLAGTHMPPGAPDWALPSPAMPMVWEGLSDRQLCLLLKDPQQNGHRSMGQILEHMHTPLVLWGWNPGDGRTSISMPQEQFLGRVGEWIKDGSACPASAPTQPAQTR